VNTLGSLSTRGADLTENFRHYIDKPLAIERWETLVAQGQRENLPKQVCPQRDLARQEEESQIAAFILTTKWPDQWEIFGGAVAAAVRSHN